jgi:hypothetical protein
MKQLTILLALLSTSLFGQNIPFPTDLKKDSILLELNTFEMTTQLLNKEFERSNGAEKCKERKKAIETTTIPHNRAAIGDTYAVAIPYNIIDWINDAIVNSARKSTKVRFMVIHDDLEYYPIKTFRYILRYKYVIKNGDPLETSMFFYFYDRKEHKDLIDYEHINERPTFKPVLFYTGKNMSPFYDMIRLYDVRKNFEKFFIEFFPSSQAH